MHASVSGCGDEVFDDDGEAIAAARLLLSYLPDDFRPRPRAASRAAPERDDSATGSSRPTRTPLRRA